MQAIDQNKVSISNEEFTLFRNYIEDACGIKIGDEKSYLFESRLASLLKDACCDTFRDLYQKIKSQPNLGLRDKLIDAMTTNETYWFRDKHPYTVLAEHIFPEYIDSIKKGKRRTISIWCAACSTGQEPYSIAMTFLEYLSKVRGIDPDALKITATDISGYTLSQAMIGQYDAFNMSRGISEDYKNRYFEFDGNVYSIAPEIKKMVRFRQFNLQNNFDSLGRFDIVFCRNVIIYFSKAFKVQIFLKISKLLMRHGIMFLGASETISEFSDGFERNQIGSGVYYKSKNM